jgi:NAD(P)-dependent dehydrogenase (short-subunit alcohol dehydrogenase family)
MTGRLRGQHAVVTGGGRGVGAAIAAAIAAEGASLTLMGRTHATIEAQAARLAGSSSAAVRAVTCDVADATSVTRAFEAAVAALGPAHILINNAGRAEAAPIGQTTLEAWERTIAVNLTGTFLCIKQVLPPMLAARQGRIINVASTAGLRGYAQVAAYCAAKHGIVGLTRALAAETASGGVTVNAICPGYIEGTPMLDAAIAGVAAATGTTADQARAILARRSPDGTFATMQEVADAVVRLCLPAASATTGQAIVVAGGEVIPS